VRIEKNEQMITKICNQMPVTYIYRSTMFDGKCYLLPIASLYEMADIVATEQVFWALLWTLRTIYNQFTYIF
jgi:hypothetical protein